jgi:uncharacterized membrane protein
MPPTPLPLRRVLVFACAHAVVTLCMTLYAFSASSAEFDNPDLPRSATAKAVGTLVNVLSLPGRLVWTTWASKNLPNAVEWVVFLANSLVWGLLIAAAATMLSGRPLKPPSPSRRF